MIQAIVNQLRRASVDDGRDDKDFTEQKTLWQQAADHLRDGAKRMAEAADMLERAIERDLRRSH